jgi:hypothetical protein
MTTLDSPLLAPSQPALRRRAWPALPLLPLLLTALYLAVAAPLIFTHAMWIDEAQAFIIARDSPNPLALLHNLRYEGHPPLWHFLLWLITRLTVRPEAMQAFHLTLAATTVFLVARYSPFPLLAKILFPFGYFPLFEYGIISRNYQLLMLLSFAFVALWQRRRTAFLPLSLLLAGLAITHVLGVILAAALSLMLLFDALLTPDGRRSIRLHPLSFTLALLIAAGGALLSVKLLIPPPDYGYSVGWHTTWDRSQAIHVLSILWDGLLPLPPHYVHFWQNILPHGSPEIIEQAAQGGVGLALIALLCMITSWRAILFYLISTLGQLSFSYIKFFGGVRHHGVLFITLIAALWIAWGLQKPLPAASPLWRKALRWPPRLALIAFLAIHVHSAALAAYYAWQVPFAAGKAAGLALAHNLHPDDLLVADMEFVAPSLAPYVPGHSFIFPATHRTGTFILWERRGAWQPSGINAALRLARENHRPILWITRDPYPANAPNIHLLAHFDGGGESLQDAKAIVAMETFTLYRITP